MLLIPSVAAVSRIVLNITICDCRQTYVCNSFGLSTENCDCWVVYDTTLIVWALCSLERIKALTDDGESAAVFCTVVLSLSPGPVVSVLVEKET